MRLPWILGVSAALLSPTLAWADEPEHDDTAPETPARPASHSPVELGLLIGHQETIGSGSNPFGATFAARLTVRPRATPLLFRASYLFGLGSPPPSDTHTGRHAHSMISEVGLAFGRRVEGRLTLGAGFVVSHRSSRFETHMAATSGAGVGVRLGPWFLSVEASATAITGDDVYFLLSGLGGLAYTFE